MQLPEVTAREGQPSPHTIAWYPLLLKSLQFITANLVVEQFTDREQHRRQRLGKKPNRGKKHLSNNICAASLTAQGTLFA